SDEFDLGDRALRKRDIRRRIFEQHATTERRLNEVDMADDAIQRFLRIRQRQQIVEKGAAMRRPGQMLGKSRGLIMIAKPLEACELFAMERRRRPDRQSDAVNRECETIAQRAQLRMRRTAGPHVVLGVNFDEVDQLVAGADIVKVLRLEADAGTGRKMRW